MQSIQVTQKAIQEISRGERHALLLVGAAAPFLVGETVELVSQDASESVGTITVREVLSRRLRDFPNHEDLLVEAIAPHDFDPDLIATKITFSFQPHEKKHEVEGNVVKKYTNITEVSIYGDGGSRGNPGPSAAGWVIYDMDGNILKSDGHYMGITTNNQAEYTALKLGLLDAERLGAQRVNVFMDSLLVINQLKGVYKVKNKELWPIYAAIVQQCEQAFDSVTFTHVPREKNKAADAMVNKVLDEVAESNN
ncbi:ribonuclease HI family protein [Candidatus Saccharibacteria bacterium]|nr:ribonuclease HI family protein [Candidatus Saccharibacteria bacterium]